MTSLLFFCGLPVFNFCALWFKFEQVDFPSIYYNLMNEDTCMMDPVFIENFAFKIHAKHLHIYE